MKRTELREHIFRIVFQAEFHTTEQMKKQAQYYLDMLKEVSDSDREYIQKKSLRVMEVIPEIDALLNQVASGWSTNRMNKADLAILRLAVYEMRWDDDIPVSVAINEAIDLCHRYDADEGASFVNGVLSGISKLETKE